MKTVLMGFLSLFLFAFLLQCRAGNPSLKAVVENGEGSAYYFSSSEGDDGNPCTAKSPCRTLTKASSFLYRPSDKVRFKRGDVWTGQELVINGSGSRKVWISVEPYGEGDKKPHFTEPPPDPTPGLITGWDFLGFPEVHKRNHREQMRIAVRIEGSYVKLSGIELSRSEMAIYAPPPPKSTGSPTGRVGLLLEDLYVHDIYLMMPKVPDWNCDDEECFLLWGGGGIYGDTYPDPAWGGIEVHGNDMRMSGIRIERSSGGISGFGAKVSIDNVFEDEIRTGGLTFGGHNIKMSHITNLRAQAPGPNCGVDDPCDTGAFFGADPYMGGGDTELEIRDSEFAYSDNLTGTGDSSPVDFDEASDDTGMRRVFAHDNTGSCVEIGMAGENRDLTIEDTVCYNNGLEDDRRPEADYLKAAFLADGNFNYSEQHVTLRGNTIYKAFPDQRLNYSFSPGGFFDDFSYLGGEYYTVSDNRVVAYDDMLRLPFLPVPPPPLTGLANSARGADVRVSSGVETASLANDGSYKTAWRSTEETPSLTLRWRSPQRIGSLRLFNLPATPEQHGPIVLATLTLHRADGTARVERILGGLQSNGAMREVVLDPPEEEVEALAFVVTENWSARKAGNYNAGLTEIEAYPPAGDVKIPPEPKPGDFTIGFAGRPDEPTRLRGRYPENDPNGIDFGGGWTTGDHSLYVDFRRHYASGRGRPLTAFRIFTLPWDRVLKRVRVACPLGATVAFSQVGHSSSSVECGGTETPVEHRTGWEAADSNIVETWIDVSRVTGAGADVNDVRILEIEYED